MTANGKPGDRWALVTEDQEGVTIEFFKDQEEAVERFMAEFNGAAGVMGPEPALAELHGDNTYGPVLAEELDVRLQDIRERIREG